MKIAILNPTFSKFSGIDRLIEQNLKTFKEQGHEVTVFCFEKDIDTNLAEVVTLGMPSSVFMQRIYRLFYFLFPWKVNNAVNQLKDFDKVIAHLYPMTIIASKAKKKFNLKYTYHDAGVAHPNLFRKLSERIYLKLFTRFSDKSIANADELIFISDFLRKEMNKRTGQTGTVEYVPIDKERFKPDINGKNIKEKHNLTSPVLLYVGRISPHKNIHGLLEAFKIIKNKHKNSTLVIIGKQTFPDYTKELKAITKESVIFTGFVPDKLLPYYYAASDLYVTASLWEGFDIPIVEANTMIKKAVCFDIGSHKEVLKKGTLVTTLTPEALAEGIEKEL